MNLVNARSAAPIRKVSIGALLGFVVWAAALIIEAGSTLEIPGWLQSAATYVVFFGGAYLAKSEAGELP